MEQDSSAFSVCPLGVLSSDLVLGGALTWSEIRVPIPGPLGNVPAVSHVQL